MKFKNKKGNAIVWVVIIILAILIAAGIWYWQSRSVTSVNPPAQQSSDLNNDTTSAIQSDINSVDTGADLEKEMDQQLDADINSL
jgi:predicted negative regulator of RcsB-dependent stress response